MANVMDLGFSAKTGTLYAGSQVQCPNFTQPDIQVPSGTITTAWINGFNKYVFYVPLTTATAINTLLTISGLPSGISDLYTVDTITISSFTGAVATSPTYTVSRTIIGTNLNALVSSTVSPSFSSGTGYVKVSITFNLD